MNLKAHQPLIRFACAFLVAAVAVAAQLPAWGAGMQPSSDPSASGTKPPIKADAPDHVVVQHILIGFKGSVGDKPIDRTMEEAKKLAEELLARARKGEDFDKLVKQYTNDAAPGIYGMANFGVQPGSAESLRAGMVKAFGDVSFSLKVGEIGMASYDPKTSKFGWHIIKRLK